MYLLQWARARAAVNCRVLQSFIKAAGCLMLLLFHTSFAMAFDFYIHPTNLVSRKSSDPCSVVKVHSAFKAKDGSLQHQEGLGWMVAGPQGLGVVTPFHVVVNADAVVGECRGQFFDLAPKAVDGEKDIAYLQLVHTGLIHAKVLSPLVFIEDAKNPSAYGRLFTSPDIQRNRWLMNLPHFALTTGLQGILQKMSGYGVAVSAEKDSEMPVLMSALSKDLVHAVIDKDQAFAKQMIRVENFGVRPGLSGAPLFGVPEEYITPLEVLPKAVLGMVVKTKNNGAETVALSLGDIYDFLEERVLAKPANIVRGLEVHYQAIAEGERTRLQSYLTLKNANTAMSFVETCSEEYRNSAEFKITIDPKLQKQLEDRQKMRIFLDPKENLLKEKKSVPMPKDPPGKSLYGGGEYGEGGDGFAMMGSEFLTSLTSIGSFNNLNLDYRALERVPSMGLYLQKGLCRQQGLWSGQKLLNTVQIPGEKAIRLSTNEDLRQFYLRYQGRALDLIQHYGRYETTPAFSLNMTEGTSENRDLSVNHKISSQQAEWRPAGHDYFKNVLAKGSPSVGRLLVTKQSLSLETRLNTFSKEASMLQLQYQNQQWQGLVSLGSQCLIRLAPERFIGVTPWLVEYSDGGNRLSIELNTKNRVMSVQIKKLACSAAAKMALGEIEILEGL
ncbi:MAG: hypothetical protein JSU04_19705 [Bdellovibrionales bacterium]|nr:hypothetical protein [Bdellovibrionales bacterium]